MTSPFTILQVRDDIFVMLGVLLRKLVTAGRGQDLSAVGDLEFAPCVGVLNIRFGRAASRVWAVG